MARPLTIRNAAIWNGTRAEPRDLYCAARVQDRPSRRAATVDLTGCTIYPGLVNAHDHLELNHFPRARFHDRYPNAHAWGEDVNARLDDEPFRSLRSHPLRDRCFIGGLKNLLSGAMTVAHHGPPHRDLFRRTFPVRVLKRYGWAHSLHFSADAEIVASYRRTPPDVPWFIHLAEGTDAIAASEYGRLKALGCIGPNTVIVHGVGLTDADIADAAPRVRGLVWCPSTNHYLLDAAAPVEQWLAAGGRLALGSDSRLTADGDLLDEIRCAHGHTGMPMDRLMPLVTAASADLLGLPDCGHLNPGARADWFAIPATDTLADIGRTDIALIVRGGVPLIGDPALMAQYPHIETTAAFLNGMPKHIHADLAHLIDRCAISEPGLQLAR
jgi:hypothetical protein